MLNTKKTLPFAISKEVLTIHYAVMKHCVYGIPKRVAHRLLYDSHFSNPWQLQTIKDSTGDSLLHFIAQLGPVYGKIVQTVMMGLSEEQQKILYEFGLDRILGKWPSIPLTEITKILDEEIPLWREQFTLDTEPIGVASMAQVHRCVDLQGNEWVVKILKPDSCRRLTETTQIIEQALNLLEPVQFSQATKSLIRDGRELIANLRLEMSLLNEKENIERMSEKLKSKKNQMLAIPQVNEAFCTDKVLMIEKFNGIKISDIITQKIDVEQSQRKKIAKTLFGELLVQIFEFGLFHGDPHAGNLILLENGKIGIFDWGLAGELAAEDRHHIAAILRSLLTLDKNMLVDSIFELAQYANPDQQISKDMILHSIDQFIAEIKNKEASGEKLTIVDSINGCLSAMNELQLQLPSGLLMMAKSLVTIEGLAKGIDPDVALKRIASPLLFKAAKPSLKDILQMSKHFPKLVKKVMF